MQHFGLWRVLTWLIGLLGNRDRGRQHCNKERKEHFSHELFYRVVRTFPTDWTDNRSPRARFADAGASIEPLRQSTRQSAGSIMGRVHMSQLRAAHDLLYCRP